MRTNTRNKFFEIFDWLLSERVRLRIMVGSFPIAFVLGVFGYRNYPTGEETFFWNSAYHTAQLFILHASHFEEPVPWTLGIARWLAPISAILAVLNTAFYLFRNESRSWSIKLLKGHTILCGLGEIGNSLANSFPDKKKLVIIEKESENENLSKLIKAGVKVYNGNALDIEVLRKVGIARASCLYALTGDDIGNLTIISNAMTILKDFHSGNSGMMLAGNIDSLNLKKAAYEEIFVFNDNQNCELQKLLGAFRGKAVEITHQKNSLETQAQLSEELDQLKIKLLDYDPATHPDKNEPDNKVKLFNINELAARYIFRQYPPDTFRPVTNVQTPPVHILLLGFSQMGEELFKLCVQNCHYINRKNTRITILYQDADLAGNKIHAKHKNITKLVDLQFVKLNPHHLTRESLIENDLTGVDVIYICSEDDCSQISYSAKALKVFGKNVPVIRWFSKNSLIGTINKDASNIFSVEILIFVATPQNIINEVIDCKAIAIHNRWLRRDIAGYINKVEKNIREKQEIPAPKATLLPWHLLDEEIRDDNRSVVEHNIIKLRNVGQVTDSSFFLNPENAPVDFSFLKDDAIVKQLAEMEHRRWMANKYLNAWEYNPERCDPKMQHNDLMAFDDLDPDTKDYDIKQIKELKEVWELKCSNKMNQ